MTQAEQVREIVGVLRYVMAVCDHLAYRHFTLDLTTQLYPVKERMQKLIEAAEGEPQFYPVDPVETETTQPIPSLPGEKKKPGRPKMTEAQRAAVGQRLKEGRERKRLTKAAGA